MGKGGSSKKKNSGSGSMLVSGTVIRNKMRIWVDARAMLLLTLKTGDTCEFLILFFGLDVLVFLESSNFPLLIDRTHRVIIAETRELTRMSRHNQSSS